jgi:hypothetical protein
MTACEIVKEVIFLMRFVNSFLSLNEQMGSVTLLKDNIRCIKMINNLKDRKRIKHIDFRYHYLREKVINREIILDWVQSANQLANSFIKSLSAPALKTWIYGFIN